MMWEHSPSHFKMDNVISGLPSSIEGQEDDLNKWPRVGVTNKVSPVCQQECSKVKGHVVLPCFCCD